MCVFDRVRQLWTEDPCFACVRIYNNKQLAVMIMLTHRLKCVNFNGHKLWIRILFQYFSVIFHHILARVVIDVFRIMTPRYFKLWQFSLQLWKTLNKWIWKNACVHILFWKTKILASVVIRDFQYLFFTEGDISGKYDTI